MSLRASGKTHASHVLQEVTSLSPKRVKSYRNVYKQSLVSQLMSGEDALAVLVDAKLSRHQYNII